MDCSEVIERLAEYLDHDCSAEVARAIEAHLERCADCRFEVDTLKQTIILYQNDEPEPPAPKPTPKSPDVDHCLVAALAVLREGYSRHAFYQERDIVWMLQRFLKRLCPDGHRVFNDFPIRHGARRSLSADLAIVDITGRPRLVVEVKYEPDHRRGGPEGDIWPTKLNPSVVFWGAEGVCGDVERVRGFVADELADVACSVFVDEGGHFRHREPPPGAKWVDWQVDGDPERVVSVLVSRFAR